MTSVASPAGIQNEHEAREYARCAVDFPHFVDNHCMIYDKDTGEQFIPFRLWPGQRWVAWLLVVLRMLLILKARQLGISWLVAAYIAWRSVYQKGFSAIIVSRTDDDATEFVKRIRYIIQHLPPWFGVRASGPDHHLKILAPRADGRAWEEVADAQAKAQTKNAGRSLTASVVVLDEYAFMPWAREIWRASFATFYRPTGGQVFVLSTMELGTHFAELCREAMRKQGDGMRRFFFAFLPWWVRPDRDVAWYRTVADNLKDDVFTEAPSTPQEAFKTKTGRLVPEYDEEIHYIEPFPIPKDWGWRWLEMIDPGSTAPTAYELVAIDPKGRLYFMDELYMPGARISEVVAAIKRLRERWGLLPAKDGMKVEASLIDPAADAEKSKEQASDLELYREQFRKQGVPGGIIKANNEKGIKRLRERFQPVQVPDDSPKGWKWDAQAYVTKNCPYLNDQLINLVWDKPKFEGENVTDWSGEDHAFDLARYVSNYLPAPGKGPAPEEQSPVAKAKQKALAALKRRRAQTGRRR